MKMYHDPRTQLRILRELVEKHQRETTNLQDRQLFMALLAQIDVLLATPGPIQTENVLDLMERFWLIAASKRIPQRLPDSE